MDTASQTRKRTIKRAINQLLQPFDASEEDLRTPHQIITELFVSLNELSDHIFRGIQAAVSPTGQADELYESIERLRQTRELVNSLPKGRPFCRLVDFSDRLLSEFTTSIVGFLEAAVAEFPLAAQRKARDGQRHLDVASDYIAEVTNSLRFWIDTTSNSPSGLINNLLFFAYEYSGSSDIFTLERYGQPIVEDIFDVDLQLSPGLGTQVALYALLADWMLDAPRVQVQS